MTLNPLASQLVPMKNTARIAAIHPSVVAAFFELGRRNALTPLEMASVPVMATHPSANARKIRKVNANPTGQAVPCCCAESGSTRCGSADRHNVGAPELRDADDDQQEHQRDEHVGRHAEHHAGLSHPRRLTSMSTTIDTVQSSTVCGARDAYADVIAAIPPEMETATVRM